MTEESYYYYLIVRESNEFDPARVADVLSRIQSIPRFDAMNHVRRNWGILYSAADRSKVEELQQKLHQEGMDTVIISRADFKPVPQAMLLKRAVPLEQGLNVQEWGKEEIYPWKDFVVVCAGHVEESRQVQNTLAPSKETGKWMGKTVSTVALAFGVSTDTNTNMAGMKNQANFNHYLDMITKNDSVSFQILGEKFDYSCLGTRKQYNIDLNFKTLVSDIAGFLPHAIKNRGVCSVESNDMKGLRYSSMQEYEQEKLWLIQLTNNVLDQ